MTVKTVKNCNTITEYRTDVLRQPQAEIARMAGVKQAWISKIESGHLPRSWNRAKLCAAYKLKDDDFTRLIVASARARAIQKPISETEPLFALAELTARAETPMEHEVARQAALNVLAQKLRLA